MYTAVFEGEAHLPRIPWTWCILRKEGVGAWTRGGYAMCVRRSTLVVHDKIVLGWAGPMYGTERSVAYYVVVV